jgi:hypothetical protein
VPRLDKAFKPNRLSHIEEFGKETKGTLEEPLQITEAIKFFTPKKTKKKIIQADLNAKKFP